MAQPAPDSTPQSRSRGFTTHLSSRGHVVIPEEILDRLDLRPGMAFTVAGEGDRVVLTRLPPRSNAELMAAMDRAQEWAREVGLTPEDVERAILEVRAERRAERKAEGDIE